MDLVALLRSIREAQPALATISSPEPQETGSGESLERFLARLPSLLQQGEARPTHKARVRPPRHWRTRKDPFEGVWCEVLLWLEKDPHTNKPRRQGNRQAGGTERPGLSVYQGRRRTVKNPRTPATGAKDLLARLCKAHPDRFGDAQLRMLQRRVKDRRGVMAKKLVYAASDEPLLEQIDRGELVLAGTGVRG